MSVEIGAKVAGVGTGASLGPTPKQAENQHHTDALFDRAAEDLADGGRPASELRPSDLERLLAQPSPLDRFRDEATRTDG